MKILFAAASQAPTQKQSVHTNSARQQKDKDCKNDTSVKHNKKKSMVVQEVVRSV